MSHNKTFSNDPAPEHEPETFGWLDVGPGSLDAGSKRDAEILKELQTKFGMNAIPTGQCILKRVGCFKKHLFLQYKIQPKSGEKD